MTGRQTSLPGAEYPFWSTFPDAWKTLWSGGVPLVYCFWGPFFGGLFLLNFLSVHVDGAGGTGFFLLACGWPALWGRPVFLSAARFPGEPLWAQAARLSVLLSGMAACAGFLALAFALAL